MATLLESAQGKEGSKSCAGPFSNGGCHRIYGLESHILFAWSCEPTLPQESPMSWWGHRRHRTWWELKKLLYLTRVLIFKEESHQRKDSLFFFPLFWPIRIGGGCPKGMTETDPKHQIFQGTQFERFPWFESGHPLNRERRSNARIPLNCAGNQVSASLIKAIYSTFSELRCSRCLVFQV